MATVDPTRMRLGRIRCLVDAIGRMKKGQPLPETLCFVPKELRFEYEGEESLNVHEEPKETAKVVEKLHGAKRVQFTCEPGLPLFNSAGGWMQVVRPYKGWVLLQPAEKTLKGKLLQRSRRKEEDQSEGGEQELTDWLSVVEHMCSLQIVKPAVKVTADEGLRDKLQTPPSGWGLEEDDELAQFLVEQLTKAELTGGKHGSEHFVRVEASSEESELSNLFTSDPDNYWESDGSQGGHWLRFHIKPGIVIEKFALLVDPDDGSYLPKRVVVKAGTRGNLTVLETRNFSVSDYERKELHLFPCSLDSYKEIIEVHVKSCYQNGIDTRVRGVSLIIRSMESFFLDSESIHRDIFTEEKITRYPKLQPFTPEQLFHRALILKRLTSLLDLDFSYLLPQSSRGHGNRTLDTVAAIRQLWPLSRKRDAIISQLLSDTSTSPPSRPEFFLNRMAAKQHRDDPSQDPECSRAIFSQLLRELKKHTKPTTYNFRWAGNWSQWWECKFVQEGIIDQGGGFRDSLADLADELCPSDPKAEVALPFFIRSPNQSQDSLNVYRDAYVPNPNCKQFAKYEFIGQLLGAMFRSQENLVLSLPQYVWKHLIVEPVTWARDFITVDSAEVKLVDSIETMSRDKFEATFAGFLNFTTVLSNGDTVPLVPDGADKLVTYDDRLEYCRLVKEVRMAESRPQMEALRRGLAKVIPSEVLGLLTWQELEVKVCGNPEITIKALKSSARYDSGLSEDNPRVKTMWAALEKFSNEDRSRFLRFITGRRRLPCTFFIDSSDSGSSLPTSATCSNALYLPRYSSVDEAVERLRYAAYNCIAIDTDRSPWD